MNMTGVETKVFPIEALREFCTGVFLHSGVPKNDAMQAAEVLACADLRGIDSHGVARLHSYFDMFPSSSSLQEWVTSGAIRSTRREWMHPRVESFAPRESSGHGAPVRIAIATHIRDFPSPPRLHSTEQ
jgi:hypothetical protein